MLRGEQCHRAALLVAMLAFLSAGLPPPPAFAQPAGIDPQAAKLLKASTDFLAGRKEFSVDARSTLEVVLVSGQKIQFDHTAKLSAQRPDKMRAERTGDLVDQVFSYDGTSLTLYNPGSGHYATVAAPATLEGMLDFARDSLDVFAPAGDLIRENAFALLMQDVTDGFVVGKSMVEGMRCDHLAFRAPEVDWQIWIQEGALPLPRKFVITTKDVVNAPQFAVVVTNWNLEPKFTPQTFSFSPPKDGKAVSFLPVGTGGR